MPSRQSDARRVERPQPEHYAWDRAWKPVVSPQSVEENDS
jgi:hypothetical protein